MTVKFHSEARKEFFEPAEYYEEQVVGLGDDFIDEVEKVVDVIEQQLTSGTKITNTERRFLVSRFPYGIIYSVEGDHITIFAVMNLRRKPGYWNPELKSRGYNQRSSGRVCNSGFWRVGCIAA